MALLGQGQGFGAQRDAAPVRGRFVLALAAGLAAGIYYLRWALPDPNEGVTHLYAIPIALIAVAFGAVAAVSAAACSLVLFAIWDLTSDAVAIGPLGYVTRGTAWLLLATLVGRYATQRRVLVEQLRELTDTDQLTGAANRARFERELGVELSLAARSERCGAIVMVDLDDFKSVNDTHGHRVGDAVLKEVARVLMARARRSDLVARLGGDEFVILMRETGGAGVEAVAAEIAKSLASNDVIAGSVRVRLRASVGAITFDRTTAASAEDLVDAADRAMYKVKARARDGEPAVGAGAHR